jgi:hypothetical protein
MTFLQEMASTAIKAVRAANFGLMGGSKINER